MVVVTILQSIVVLILTWLAWTVLTGVFNLTFHPLAKYPGPKLAAFTIWWKMYTELVDDVNLTDRLFDLHAKYGDVVRIAPNELHFSRPSAYHEIYNPRNRWTKDPMLYHIFAQSESTFSIVEYAKAKKRKDILLPLFSRKAIVDMQHLIQSCVDQLCDGIAEQHATGESLNMLRAFRCFAVDAITSFCFARSMGALAEPGFHAPIEQAMALSLPTVPWSKYFSVVKFLASRLPPALIAVLRPGLVGLIRLRVMLSNQVREVIAHPEMLVNAAHPIIYHELLNPAHGQQVPSFVSLRDEALLLVFAGTDTTSNTLALGTTNILSNPDIHAKLMQELVAAWPDVHAKPRYEVLDSLPYLRACIKESLRLVQGVLTPMTRVVPHGGAEISGHYIPGGALVAVSAPFVHLNGAVFPEPHTFKPERWLGSSGEQLDNWLVSFSKGPRSCLGVNLAYCELFMTFANIFRRFDMHLDGVGPADLRWKEYYLPHYDGPELRVTAKPRVN